MAGKDKATFSRRSRLDVPDELRQPSAPAPNQDKAEERQTDHPIFGDGGSEPIAHHVAAAPAMTDEEAGCMEPDYRPLRPTPPPSRKA
ncbi:hypothetical protein ACUN0C_08060 [Faunimonas sp. B44]|uniref:hypothetical protein n=1 Tax=Faunimonas sp. B44 TaxID=3461493 RepID=UPI004043A709